jgi:hypothetical protein
MSGIEGENEFKLISITRVVVDCTAIINNTLIHSVLYLF